MSNKEYNKIKALDELFEQSLTYKSTTKFKELLDFITHFPSLSPFNAFLIHMQNSGVQIVMSRSKWKKYNRSVIYGSRPLVILIPFGPVEFVYDIKDTEGEDIPEELLNPFKTEGGVNTNMYFTTIKNCLKEEIVIKEKILMDNLAGYVKRESNHFSITVNSNLGINERFSTLAHELAHIFCGHLGVFNNSTWRDRHTLSKEIKEVEAESISYLVCLRMGLKTNSESYLSSYLKENTSMPSLSLDTILTVSGLIETIGTYRYKPKKKTK